MRTRQRMKSEGPSTFGFTGAAISPECDQITQVWDYWTVKLKRCVSV